MSFKDTTWLSRYDHLGDEAEAQFERYATDTLKRKFVRFGLNRPPLKVPMLPARIRYTPDYLMSKCFVEVQGFGQDQRLKLKVEKLNALHWWNDLRTHEFEGVSFYVWDSLNERETFFPLSKFDYLLDVGKGGLGTFPEGKSYFWFDAEDVFS